MCCPAKRISRSAGAKKSGRVLWLYKHLVPNGTADRSTAVLTYCANFRVRDQDTRTRAALFNKQINKSGILSAHEQPAQLD